MKMLIDCFRLCLVVFLVSSCGASAEAYKVADTEDYFQQVETVDDLPSLIPHGVLITDVTADGFAERFGVRVGDEILAINGVAVLSAREYFYVRQWLASDEDSMALILRRRGRVFELNVTSLKVGRKAGFSVKDGVNEDLVSDLETLGVKVPKSACQSLRRLPKRAILELRQWQSRGEADSSVVDGLQQFVELHDHVVHRRWAKASEIEPRIPIAYFQKLCDFYGSIARRNFAGEQDPSFNAHGVSRAFYLFHYPVPRFEPPPLGKWESKDPFLMRTVRTIHEQGYPIVPLKRREDEMVDDLYAGSVRSYVHGVVMSIAEPKTNGGWPMLHTIVHDRSLRKELIKNLDEQIKKRDSEEPIYRYCAIFACAIDGKIYKCEEHFHALSRLSPYLAEFSVPVVHLTAIVWGRPVVSRRIMAIARRKSQADSARRSRFYDYVSARCRHLQEHSYDATTAMLTMPESYAGAFDHELTLQEEAEQLDADIAATDFAKHRGELLKRVEALAIPKMLSTDVQRLAKIGRDDGGKGMILDSFIRISSLSLHSNWIETRYLKKPDERELLRAVNDGLVRGVFWETSGKKTGYPYVHALLKTVDWSDKEAARKQLHQAYLDQGTPAAAAIIQDALVERGGLDEDDLDYQTKVEELMRLVLHLNGPYFGQFGVHVVETASLAGVDSDVCNSADVITRAYLNSPNKNLRMEPPPFLITARAHLYNGRLTQAIDILNESFEAVPPKKIRQCYLYDGKVDDDPDAYRRWLVKRLRNHEGFSAKHEKQILESGLE